MKHVIDHVRSIWNFCFRRFGQSEDDQNLFTRLVEFSHLGGTLARLKNVLQWKENVDKIEACAYHCH